jgi:EAL domain-containing protein (putative c-di-GMP-specific phosphodiesterase class I)
MSSNGRFQTTQVDPTGLPRATSLLIVDDDPAVLKMTRKRLERRGHRVVACSSGRAALAALASETFDAMISDVRMPAMTGMELLRAVRERDLDLPVVLITGDPGVESASAAVEYGAFQYLTKPVAAGQLEHAAERAVAMGQMARLKRQFIEEANSGVFRVSDRAGADAIVDRALECLYLLYQPVVCVGEARTFGYEAFMRSSDDVAPLPNTIFRAAERSRRVAELERKVRDTAALAMRNADPSWVFFVNLHPRDLLDDLLYDDEAPLAQCASRVVLEITDRAALQTIPGLRERARDLRRLGYRIGLDDLGAGYAGLTSFVSLEPEFVKLDASLVRDVDLVDGKRQVIGSLTQLCGEIGARVVAEGVETPGERDALIGLGCDLLQGGLYGAPSPMPTSA